jgi:hypothetical protein
MKRLILERRFREVGKPDQETPTEILTAQPSVPQK